MTKEKVPNDRKAVYVGRRLSYGGEIVQRFELLPDRTPISFQGIKSVWIGYTYKCTENTMPVTPDRTEDEKEENAHWQAKDALVTVEINRKRAESKMKKLATYDLDRAVERLKPLVNGLLPYEKEALVRYLIERAK